MGLLDDAIREHLELKRSHGADPDEVARQENEALGETRRAEFARPEGAEPPAERAASEPVAEAAALEPVGEAPSEPAAEAAASEPAADAASSEPAADADSSEPAFEPEPAAEAALPEPPLEREPMPEAEEPPAAPAAPAEPAEPPPPATDPWLDEDHDEVPADEALDHPRTAEATEPAPEEDVLEETPDFLQETPEHDRLWFEQRPPRDFDWDK